MILYIPHFDEDYEIQAIVNPIPNNPDLSTILTWNLKRYLPGYFKSFRKLGKNQLLTAGTAHLWRGRKIQVLSFIYEYEKMIFDCSKEFEDIVAYVKDNYKNMRLKSLLIHPYIWEYSDLDEEDGRKYIEQELGYLPDLDVYMILNDDRRPDSSLATFWEFLKEE